MKKNTCLNISLDKVLVYICIAAIVFEVFINFRVGFLSFSNIIIITSFFLQCLIKKKMVLNRYEKHFIFFICWCALSIVWTPYSASGAFFRIIDTLLVLVMILSVTQYCTKDDKIYVSKCEDIIKFYIFCTVVLTLVCYCAEGYRLLSWARLGSSVFDDFSGQTGFTMILIPAMLFSIWFFLQGENRKLYGVLSVFFFLSGVLTGVRKSIIIPLIFIYLYLLLYRKKNVLKMIGITALCIICVTILIMFIMRYSSSMAHRLNILIQSLINPNLNSTTLGVIDNSLDIRSDLRALALQCFKEHPILGVGIGGFRTYSVAHGGYDLYAHNNWLELLANVGIIGFLLFYCNYIKIFFNNIKKNNHISFFLCSFILTFFVYEYGQVTYYFSISGMLFGIIYCLDRVTIGLKN